MASEVWCFSTSSRMPYAAMRASPPPSISDRTSLRSATLGRILELVLGELPVSVRLLGVLLTRQQGLA